MRASSVTLYLRGGMNHVVAALEAEQDGTGDAMIADATDMGILA